MSTQTSKAVRIAKCFTRKEQAIAALLAKKSVQEAARVTGIGTQTLNRWLKDQEFDSAYQAAKRAIVAQEALAVLRQGSRAAVETILKIMLDPGTPTSTRLCAAEFVLGVAKDASEREDNEARLAGDVKSPTHRNTPVRSRAR